jgi:rhodanese-related sulfurtransferase
MKVVLLLFAFAVGMFQSGVKQLSQDTLKNYLESKQAPFDFVLVDVRGAGEISSAIGSAECKPYNLAWPNRFKLMAAAIPKNVAVIIYCQSGVRSAQAAAFLDSVGYTSVYDAGAFRTWNGPTVPPSEIKPASLLPELSFVRKTGQPTADIQRFRILLHQPLQPFPSIS